MLCVLLVLCCPNPDLNPDLLIWSSRIFHFVTRDYFRYRDESSDDSDSDEEEEEERGEFVAGGIYSPPTHANNDNSHNIKLALATATGLKQYGMKSDGLVHLHLK